MVMILLLVCFRFVLEILSKNVLIGVHPWHVGLVREESKTGFLGWLRHWGGLLRTTTYCGASLVGQRWLITAAHCIRNGDRPVDLRVVMGSSKRARYFYYFYQTDSIDQIHIHPNYSNVSHVYDIAILRLKKLPDLEPGERHRELKDHAFLKKLKKDHAKINTRL